MYVEHFNHSDTGGGASIAAFRLVSALNSATLPIDAKLRVIQSSLTDASILRPTNPATLIWNRLLRFCSAQLSSLDPQSLNNPFSLSLFPSSTYRTLNRSDCQIVNLHWCQAESLSVEDLPKINKPLVWTLHDTWPFCGATHYPDDLYDQRYAVGFKPLPSKVLPFQYDLNYHTWLRKTKSWRKPIQLVCPSNWIKDCASKSIVMQGWPATVIPNPLPIDVFAPAHKPLARKQYSLPPESLVISFSAHNLSDKRKGLSLLFSLLATIRSTFTNVVALVIGAYSSELQRSLPVRSVFTGYLSTDFAMAQALSCSDVHIVPSLLDNLPQTATEAQSCGIPVLAFNVGGLSDAIEHASTGYLAKAYDIPELAKQLSTLLSDPDLRRRMSRQSRDRAVSLWSPDVVASSYYHLYANLIAT